MTAQKLILYADDDTDDRMWVTEACKTMETSIKIAFVDNGRAVIEYLENGSATVLPSLVVLDLNMPEMDGRLTLQFLKIHSRFKDIPVAIVTTSANRIDKEVCMRLGASVFLIKPNTYTGWQNIVRELEPFVT